MNDKFVGQFRLCHRENFSALNRAIQYIILSYYVDEAGIIRPDDPDAPNMDMSWYNAHKHNCMEFNICHYAPSLAAQMMVITND